jgi:hypothetical protein
MFVYIMILPYPAWRLETISQRRLKLWPPVSEKLFLFQMSARETSE